MKPNNFINSHQLQTLGHISCDKSNSIPYEKDTTRRFSFGLGGYFNLQVVFNISQRLSFRENIMTSRFNQEYLKSAASTGSSSSTAPNGSGNALVPPYSSQMLYTPGNPQGQDVIFGDYNEFATRYQTMKTASGIPLVPGETYDGQETIDNLPPTMISQPSHGNVQGYLGSFNFEGSSATLIPETNGVIANNVPNHSLGNNLPRVVSLAQGPNTNSGAFRLNSAATGNSEFPGTMHGNESHRDTAVMTSQQPYNAQPTAIKSGSFYGPYHPHQQLPAPTNVQSTGVPIPRAFHANTSGSYELNPYDNNSQAYVERPNPPQSRVVGGPVKNNKYGIYNLLIANQNPAYRYLSMGIDLTKLGVDVTSQEPFIHDQFASPWSNEPFTGVPEFTIPDCYNANQTPALKQSNFARIPEHTLVYIFYSMPQDEAQLYAANELCNRGWLYHKVLQSWLKRVPNKEPLVTTTTYEKSDYYCFDQDIWQMVLKENFVLHYEMIEKRPTLPE